jgi:site-specific DNA recombinase
MCVVAILYVRVSSEDQARTGFSLASQVEAGQRRAADLGAAEVIVCADEGVPGDVLERPGLQQALARLRERPVTWFVCYDPDRLARSLSLQLLVTDQIERAGARLEFVNFAYQQTPEGQLFYAMRGAIAQYEKAKIRERTMRGKRQKARSGGLTHNPGIYGYTFDPTADRLTPNPATAPVVPLIFRWFLEEDLSPPAIARRLTAMGVAPARGGAAWHHASVRNILRNESYTGTLHVQKWDYTDTRTNKYRPAGEKVARRLRPESDWVALPIPPLVDAATYQRAQCKLEQGRGRRRRAGSGFLLAGRAVCARCGRPVYGVRRGDLSYYVCRGYAPGVPGEPRCPFGRVRAEPLEEAVWAAMTPLLSAAVAGAPSPTDDRRAADLAVCRGQLQELHEAQARTARLLVRGLVDPAVGEALLQEQHARLQTLRAELARLEAPAETNALIESPADLTRDEKRQAVRVLVREALLDRDLRLVRLRVFTSHE